MDTSILSFSTGSRGGKPQISAPSPVLDLIYACFYLRGLGNSRHHPLPWAEELRRGSPELVASAAELVGQGEMGRALFAMALELGYATEDGPGRFLRDLPELPLLLEQIEVDEMAEGEECDDSAGPGWRENPPTAEESRHAAEVLNALWLGLLPTWEATGLASAMEAARSVESALAEHGDVLRALPRRHFAQFEDLAGSLRESYAKGTLMIVPLAFAEGGGFHLMGNRVTALGFGLHGERVHQAIERRISEAAVGAKALADPTRLMLLSLIARYRTMPMTVGDLAGQLGVSQPTVSGHLKLLREAGLVTTEKKGNKSFPKPVPGAAKKVLDALSETVIEEPN